MVAALAELALALVVILDCRELLATQRRERLGREWLQAARLSRCLVITHLIL
jgi:hypothetical protein